MSNFNLDELLINQSEHLNPPTAIIKSINPWEQPINRICFGLIFTTCSIQFFYLDIILQTIAYCSLFLGFYSIKNQNKLFEIAFFIVIIQVLYYLYSLVIYATELKPIFINPILSILWFALLPIIFHFALRLEFKKINKHMPTNIIMWLTFILMAVTFFLSKLENVPLIIVFAVMLFYICSIFTFSYITYCMTNIGFQMKATRNIISHRNFKIGYYSLIFIIIFGLNFMQTTNLKDFEIVSSDSSLNEELLNLGMPENILVDITEEDQSYLSNAKEIVVQAGPIQNSEFTIIRIQKKDNTVLHLYHYQTNESHYTDAIRVDESFRRINETMTHEIVASRILYNVGEDIYLASTKVIEADETQVPGIYVKFNYPRQAAKERGYILVQYDVKDSARDSITYEIVISLYHSDRAIQLPYRQPWEIDGNYIGQHVGVFINKFEKENSE